MRKKIIGASVVVAFLVVLCVQSVAAQVPITEYAWTDKTQYAPGETGVLQISILNLKDGPVEIYNITITYPWFVYNAEKDQWMGNATIEGNPLATMTSTGTANDHYYTEVQFTVPTDGRAAQFLTGGAIYYKIWTSEGEETDTASLLISGVSLPVSIASLDMLMMYLIAAVVVCTIILAIVFLFALPKARARSALVPRVPPPPPSKAKA